MRRLGGRHLWFTVAVAESLGAAASVGGCAGGCSRSDAQLASADAADAGDGGPEAVFDSGITQGDGGGIGFEGELSVELLDERPLLPAQERERTRGITFEVKGDAYRWNLLDNATPRGDFRIYDYSEHHFITVIHDEAIIFVSPDHPILPDSGVTYPLEDAHQQMTLNRHPCEVYNSYVGGLHYRVCATKDFVPFPFHLLWRHFDEVMPYGQELLDMHLFPMLATVYEMPDAGSPKAGHASPVVAETPIWNFRVTGEQPRAVDPTHYNLPHYNQRFSAAIQNTKQHLR